MGSNIAAPRVPFTDPKTGLISREWYALLLNLVNLTGAGQNNLSLSDLQVGPPGVSTESVAVLASAVSAFTDAIQAIQLAPAVQPLVGKVAKSTGFVAIVSTAGATSWTGTITDPNITPTSTIILSVSDNGLTGGALIPNHSNPTSGSVVYTVYSTVARSVGNTFYLEWLVF